MYFFGTILYPLPFAGSTPTCVLINSSDCVILYTKIHSINTMHMINKIFISILDAVNFLAVAYAAVKRVASAVVASAVVAVASFAVAHLLVAVKHVPPH